MGNRDKQILGKILSEIEVIVFLVSGFGFDDFSTDERTKRAVCMTLINIGELVKTLTDEIKTSHADIPWRAISGLRDVTAHRYQALRIEDLWITIKIDIPDLGTKIRNILQGVSD